MVVDEVVLVGGSVVVVVGVVVVGVVVVVVVVVIVVVDANVVVVEGADREVSVLATENPSIIGCAVYCAVVAILKFPFC